MKNMNEDSNIDIPQTGKFRTDVRALVLAHIFRREMDNLAIDKSLNGTFKYIYKKTLLLQYLLIIVLFMLFFLYKPEWCASRGDMLPDCTVDRRGVQYKLINTYFFPETLDFIITILCMLPLTVVQYFKHKNIPQFDIEKVKYILTLITLILTFVLRILVAYKIIPPTDIINSMKIFFCLFLSNTVLKTFRRMFNLLKYVGFVLTLLGVCILMFAIVFRIMFKNLTVNEYQKVEIPPYSFTSLLKSINTLTSTMFFENFPFIVPDFFRVSKVAFVFLLLYIFVTNIVLISLLTAIFYNIYQSFYIKNYDEVNYYYPYFEKVIEPVMQNAFMDTEKVNNLIKRVRQNENYLVEINDSRRKSYLAKMSRAVQKIKILKNIALGAQSHVDYTYFTFRDRFLFKLMDCFLSLYVALLPGFIINNSSLPESFETILGSELISFIFLVDIYMIYKATDKKKDFSTFYNFAELIINSGIIIMANLCFLKKIKVFDDNLNVDQLLFTSWGLFCVLKIFRIHAQLYYFINYRVIITTLIDILPLIFDLLIIYAVCILVYATLCISFFGGLYDDEFPKFIKKYTGMEDGDPKMGFNDIVIAFLTLISINISGPGGVTINTMAVVKHYKKKSEYMVLTRLFFISYFVFTTLIIINIIVGIVVDFLGVYLNNVTAIKQKENILMDSKGLFDILLDKEFKEELNKKDKVMQKRRLVNACEKVLLMSNEELAMNREKVVEKLRKAFDRRGSTTKGIF